MKRIAATATRQHGRGVLGGALVVSLVLGGVGHAATVVTTYQYNADGALTAASTSTNDQSPVTTYFTWDNFTPQVAEPSSGAVQAGDGNLLAYGASPGTASATAAFAYDRRDRLIGCMADGKPGVAHSYYANSLLASSTLSGGDAQTLYYGATPHVINQRQASTGTTASFLGPVRYLNDGREQAALGPRKDAAGLYEPSQELLTPYSYQAYGASRSPSTANEGLVEDGSRYDLSFNPFQYTGEYKDPQCAAYNLRARWYLPEPQVFLSRDPADKVHRYSYTGGNPINRSDPSGLSYRGFQKGVGGFIKKLGVGATALSVLPYIGPAMFLLQTSAAGKFWHSKSEIEMFSFMAVSGGVSAALELPAIDRWTGSRGAFAMRNLAELGSGAGQSAMAGAGGKGGRFDQQAFWENIGATAGAVLVGRVGAGIGYRPYSLTADDIHERVLAHSQSRQQGDPSVLVFSGQRIKGGRSRMWTTPWMEQAHLGVYHGVVVGVRSDADMLRYYQSHLDVLPRNFRPRRMYPDATYMDASWEDRDEELPGRYRFVGAFTKTQVRAAFETNPLGLITYEQQESFMRTQGRTANPNFHMLRRNCQDHAAGVLAALQP